MKTKCEFNVAKWDEMNCGEPVNGMVTARASIEFVSSGAINGKFNVEYLLHYTNYDKSNQHNSEATYLGYMAFSGSMDGKHGSFVFEDKGTYTPSGPASELSIKLNTGTDDFEGISGTGKYYAENNVMVIEIDYSI